MDKVLKSFFPCLVIFFLQGGPAFSMDEGQEDGKARNEAGWEYSDPSPNRLLVSQTAFSQKKKTLRLNMENASYIPIPYMLNFADLTYGITNYLDIRATILLPILWVGFGLTTKLAVPLGKYVRVGMAGIFGFVKRYAMFDHWCCPEEENIDLCKNQFIYGGSPLLVTIGTVDHYFNYSITVVGHRGYTEECRMNPDSYSCGDSLQEMIYVIQSFGFGVRIAKHAKLLLEILYIFSHERANDQELRSDWSWKHLIIPIPGFKLFWERTYFDFGIMFPVASGDSGYLVNPMIIRPVSSFGIKFF